MIKADIGTKAGTIWLHLSKKRKLSIEEIKELTSYNDHQITLALGWLARENKIRFHNQNEILQIELNSVLSDIYY